jgi:hypothetical protein
VAWNVALLTLMVAAAQSYNSCVADGGIICFDLSGPILFVMIVLDLVVGLIIGVVRMVRVRRTAARLTYPTTACSIAHSAAAARVETRILP